MKAQPQTWRQWVRAVERDTGTPSRIRPGSSAALTGTDVRVLSAVVACWELYAYTDEAGRRRCIAAIRSLLPIMQDGTRWIAKELIAFVFDWSDRDRLDRLVQEKPQ